MNRYNEHIKRHFRGCELLAESRDEHRNRVLKYYFMNTNEVVGVSDGVDSWVTGPQACHSVPRLVQLVRAAMLRAGLRVELKV